MAISFHHSYGGPGSAWVRQYKAAQARKRQPVPGQTPGMAVPPTPGITPGAGGQGPVQETVPKPVSSLPDESWKDSTYTGNQSNIQTGLNNLGSYLNQQSIGLGDDYGVDPDGTDVTHYDPAHPPAFNVDWRNVDVTNPFSKAALLVQSHEANNRGNTNSYAASGQLYSGALQNAQDAEGRAFQGGQNALTSDFAQKYGGLYGQWQAGQSAALTQGLDNTAAALLRKRPITDPKKIQEAAESPDSTVAPSLSSKGEVVPLTPLRVATAKATGSSAASQQARHLLAYMKTHPKQAAALLKKYGGGS